MSSLSFTVQEWSAFGRGTPEDVATRGFLRIDVGASCLTRNDSLWSQSTSDRVLVSMYPAALWLASNWWRLCWEPRRGEPDAEYEWLASHEFAAIGNGYLWPNVRFIADGESVSIVASPTLPNSKQPIRYINPAGFESVSRLEFERAAGDFIEKVIARLIVMNLHRTELEFLWSDVCAERLNPQETRARRLEALLGYDPDESDKDAIDALLDLQAESGESAADEVATVLSGSDVPRALQRLRAATRNGVCAPAHIDESLESALAECRAEAGTKSIPWKRGMAAASVLRSLRRVESDVVSDAGLLGLIQMEETALQTPSQLDWLPSGLAVRNDSQLRVLLRAPDLRSRRFELARVIGDLALAPIADHWHPVTRLYTSRQKAQRAFAAELLCPVDGLSRFLGDDHSQDKLDAAAEHFQVSTTVVEHQMSNHLGKITWNEDSR